MAGQGRESTLDHLIIFVKHPEAGKVKTRLAATVGHPAALAVYEHLLRHTCEVALTVPVNRHVYYGDVVPKSDLWSEAGFDRQRQIQGDLGVRMYQAMEDYFAGGASKVVLIGSDVATISPAHLQAAFDALDTHEVVIGPAKDGGYYLIGLSKSFPEVFNNINWSTHTVLEETIRQVLNAGHSYTLLELLSDVDYEEDLTPELRVYLDQFPRP